MRTLLHLSDLHFGRIDDRLLSPLLAAVAKLNPDLVVVSGDLTQRARTSQFTKAKTFLDRLPHPQIVVPGNHDVPMHNPVARFLFPLRGYRRHISEDPEPFYLDSEIAVLGLNSSRSFTIQDGRLNERQISRLRKVFGELNPDIVKILVCHHPFELPTDDKAHRKVGGADQVLAAMSECRADVVLTGHLHTTYSACTALSDKGSRWAVLLVQAGTATSTRLRGQEASFNVVRFQEQSVELTPYVWDSQMHDFLSKPAIVFARGPLGWSR
jgi:3',5'-cyclic AMP phosphodiesterase CpdA